MTLLQLTNAVLSALIAPPCAVCGRILERPLAGAVCERCWQSVGGADHLRQGHGGPPTRHSEAEALPSTRPSALPSVPRGAPSITRIACIGLYEGTLREIIHALKYEGRRSVARPLSQLMAVHGAEVLAGADLAVPVPLHHRRRRERGFNQAEDLASHIGIPVRRALRRMRFTRPQVELPAEHRFLNVRAAFEITRRRRLSGQTIVLIDDVTTTGATLEACALVLRDAGVREVRGLTAARVVSERR